MINYNITVTIKFKLESYLNEASSVSLAKEILIGEILDKGDGVITIEKSVIESDDMLLICKLNS